MRLNNKAGLAALGIVAVTGIAGTAFAASISVPSSNAGQGSATVQGYSASNLLLSDGTWLDEQTTTLTDITEITFNLVKQGGGGITDSTTSVYAQLLGDTPTSWTSCSVGTSNLVTCAFDPGKPLASTTGVSIVAYDSNNT